MSNRRFFVGLAVLVLLAGALGIFIEFRWPHWNSLQQAGYQQFFTVFTGMLAFFLATLAGWAAIQAAEASKRQAIAADRQAVAADAQAHAARMSIRPVLMPSISWDGTNHNVTVRNVGVGVATQITWALMAGNDKVPMNGFIRPSDFGMRAFQVGGFSNAMIQGDIELQPVKLSDDPYLLLLVNCLDLMGNVCQTQLLAIRGSTEDVKGAFGFGIRTVEERVALHGNKPWPADAEDSGIFAW